MTTITSPAPYLDLISKGEIGTAELDDKARRVLRLILRTAMAYDKGDGGYAARRTTMPHAR